MRTRSVGRISFLARRVNDACVAEKQRAMNERLTQAEQTVVRTPQLVSICSWCVDASEQTAAARAHGFDVTHTICARCAERWLAGERA